MNRYDFYSDDDKWLCTVWADTYREAAEVVEQQLGYVPPKYRC
jgi:hypothetical protein